MDDFFKAEGLQKIMFFFQENENMPEAGIVFSNLKITAIDYNKLDLIHEALYGWTCGCLRSSKCSYFKQPYLLQCRCHISN